MAVQEAPGLAAGENGVTTATVAVPRAWPGKIVIFEHKGHGPPLPAIIRLVSTDGKSELTVFTANSGQPLGKKCVFHRDDPGYTPNYQRNYGCWYETPEEEFRRRREAEDKAALVETINSLKAEIRGLRDKAEAGKPGKRNTPPAPEVTPGNDS